MEIEKENKKENINIIKYYGSQKQPIQETFSKGDVGLKKELNEDIMKLKSNQIDNNHPNQIDNNHQKTQNGINNENKNIDENVSIKNVDLTKLRAYRRMLESRKFLVRLNALRILKTKTEYITDLIDRIKNLEEDEHPVVRTYAKKLIVIQQAKEMKESNENSKSEKDEK